MSEALELAGLTFDIRRSSRRRTLSLTVDRGGELVIHAPSDVDEVDLAAWTRGRLLWVHRKLALKTEVPPRVRAPEYVSGESFAYLGKGYQLRLVSDQATALRFDGSRFLLRRDARPADIHFRRWYIAAGKVWLPRRIELLKARTGTTPLRISIRDLGYRWGSCGRNGSVYLNWRVLQLPVRVIDYVVVHELCHLLEPSHAIGFRRMLERALPDWTLRKEELHRKAAGIYWCTPEMAQ